MSINFNPSNEPTGPQKNQSFDHPNDGSGVASVTNIQGDGTVAGRGIGRFLVIEGFGGGDTWLSIIVNPNAASSGVTSSADSVTPEELDAINAAIANIDSDRQVGTINADAFGGPGDYPAAEENDYLLVAVAGQITHEGVTYDLKPGDRMRSIADNTAVDTPANWVVEIIERGGGLVMQAEQSADFTAAVGSEYPIDTTAIDIVVTLPATLSAGDSFAFFCSRLTSSLTRTITINSAPHALQSTSPDTAIINSPGSRIELTYVNSTVGLRVSASENQ